MKSPLTGSDRTRQVDMLETSLICHLYRHELNLNVDKYFSNLKQLEIWECQDSFYRFYYPYNIFGDAQFYEQLQAIQKGDYYPTEKWEYNEALKHIMPGMKVMEIGCGVGHFLRKAAAKSAEVYGLELNAQAVSVCQSRNLNVTEELLEAHYAHNKNVYDAVLAFQVLEHITEIGAFIQQCLDILKPGGLFIFAVPNSNPYIFKHDKYHTLNLPPHHAGLWNAGVVQHLPAFYPVKLVNLSYEPLKEYKKWFNVQRSQLKEKNAVLHGITSMIPRQVYKPVLHLFRDKLQGISMLSVLQKN